MTEAPGPHQQEIGNSPGGTQGRPRWTMFTTAVMAYLCFVGGFAAWHAAGLWSWPRIALLVVIPGILVFVQCGPSAWRFLRDGHPLLSLMFGVAAPLLAAVILGGMGLALSYLVVETVGEWESRATRTAAATGGMLVCAVMTGIAYRPGKGQPKRKF